MKRLFWIRLGVVVLVFLLLWWLYMGIMVQEDESLTVVEPIPLWMLFLKG